MAKLFYTIDEAAQRLGKTVAELSHMVAAGQLEEFKMHDAVHFKRGVIDQLVNEDVIDLDLPADDDLDLGGSAAAIQLNLNEASGNALAEATDDLKFDDDAPSGSAKPDDMELDLDLETELSLADSGAGLPVIPAASKPAATPPRAATSSEPIGLADSADASGMASLPTKQSQVNSNATEKLDLDLDMDLDLDLDLDDLEPTTTTSATPTNAMDDSRGGSGRAMILNDSSGSMAPITPQHAHEHAGAPRAAKDDFLDESGAGKSAGGSAGGSAGKSAGGSAGGSGRLSLETVGSGSGMLEDSADSDDSTIGAALLDDGDDTFGTGASVTGASEIFAEPIEGDSFEEVSSAPITAGGGGGRPTMVAMQMEQLDSPASGMSLGLMVAAMVAIILCALVVIATRMGGGSSLAGVITADMMIWIAALAGGTLLAGGIGFFVGKSIE